MARAQEDNSSLRFGRAEIARLVVALLFSALVHLIIWGGYHTGEKLGWWQRWHMPNWLQFQARPTRPQPQVVHNEDPTIFVDVSHADADAPQATKYYSDRNSRAANPEVANSNIPRIEGRQKDMPKTEDADRPVKAATRAAEEAARESREENAAEAHKEMADNNRADQRPDPNRLQPSPPAAAEPAGEPENPEAPLTPGETALKPKQVASNQSPTASPARPRTIKQALAQRDQIPGRKMQQDGGVARHALSSSLDVKSTQFGEYDRAIVEAVSQRWYDLLDSRRFADDRTGKVTLRFKLKSDGSVIEMETAENSVGELLGYLCQEAIEEAAPFGKWPPDMVRMIGANYREITFTFYYY